MFIHMRGIQSRELPRFARSIAELVPKLPKFEGISMRKLYSLTIVPVMVYLLVASCSCTSRYGQWTVTHKDVHTGDIPWAKFYWTSDSFGNKFFDRSGMNIPVTIQRLPNTFTFQLDL